MIDAIDVFIRHRQNFWQSTRTAGPYSWSGYFPWSCSCRGLSSFHFRASQRPDNEHLSAQSHLCRWFLSRIIATEMTSWTTQLWRCLHIALVQFFPGRLHNFALCCFFFAHMILRMLELASVAAIPQPWSSHLELIRRAGILSRFTPALCELLWIARSTSKPESSSSKLRVNRNILILASVTRKLLSIHWQLQAGSSAF